MEKLIKAALQEFNSNTRTKTFQVKWKKIKKLLIFPLYNLRVK